MISVKLFLKKFMKKKKISICFSVKNEFVGRLTLSQFIKPDSWSIYQSNAYLC